MKRNPFITAVAAITLSLAASVQQANAQDGFVDFDQIDLLSELNTVVDVRIGGWLLEFARDAAIESGEEDLEVLSGVDSIRVRVYELGDIDPRDVADAAELIRSDLLRDQWEDMAVVRDRHDKAYIMVKGNRDNLSGITVMAISNDDEAVFVNISGRLNSRQVAKILADNDLMGTHLDLDVDF
ncbi:MAG: hypothetical protein DHS20C11_24860 [Lysobacteraceae bacterium]|nr:MAG: hypothetical protein DHS20C11_24860 [Xanthomonadaceae bacterium]